MSWWRIHLGLAALVILSMVAHPPAVLAFLIDVRSGPGAAYEVVARIPSVRSFVAVAKVQDWYKIQLPDGREGWIQHSTLPRERHARPSPVVAPTSAMSSPTVPVAASALPSSAPPTSFPPTSTIGTVTAPLTSRSTALVIGNAAYQVGPLHNTGNDASDMAATLRRLGFDVTLLRDVPLQKMEEAVHAFNLRLRQGGMGLFYFAGHALQVDGENYLLPLNARIERQQDVRYQALPLGQVVGAMEEAGNGLNVIILDACRNAPVTRSWRSSQAGLAAPPAAGGMLIAYATAPGGMAVDGEGRNGVYTKHLLQVMTIPGLRIEQVFKQVRSGVVAETGGQQIPWESSSLLGEVAFVPSPAVTVPAVAPVSASSAPDPETVMWSMSERSAHPEDVWAFLQAYPESRFAPAARLHLQQLQRQSPPAVSGPIQVPPGSATPTRAEVSPPSPSGSAPPPQPTNRVVPPNVSAAASLGEEVGRNTPGISPSSARPARGYTLIRRIYCEDIGNGLIQSSIDLIVTSYVSCAEAKNVVLNLEQQKDNCRFPRDDNSFVDPTARESTHKAKEWVETMSCDIPS